LDSQRSDNTDKREITDSKKPYIPDSQFLQGDELEPGWSPYNPDMSGYCLSGAWGTEDSGPHGREFEDKRGRNNARYAV